MEFLNEEFITLALSPDPAATAAHDSPAFFTAALGLLNQQNFPLNCNSDLLFKWRYSPINFIIKEVNSEYYKTENAAKLVEALYLHCGIPSMRISSNHWVYNQSPLWNAACDLNLPVFETLLLKCNAEFDRTDTAKGQPSILHELAPHGNQALPFMKLLAQHYQKNCVNPNAMDNRCGCMTALHKAVFTENQSPDVVLLLIQKFDADPTIHDIRNGMLPMYYLKSMMSCAPTNLRSDGEWCEKVLRTKRLLNIKHTIAVLMGVYLPKRNQQSELRHLHKELVELIIVLTLLEG